MCHGAKPSHLRTARQRIHRERPMASSGIARHLAGLAHPATLSYLQDLGVTSIELLPIKPGNPNCSCRNAESHELLRAIPRSATFAPTSYATNAGAGSGSGRRAAGEVIDMVRAMHEAGFEVIMDVVYNHTCESVGRPVPSAGVDSTTSPITDGPKTRSAACTTRRDAAIRLTSPTRTSPPSPWIRFATGPSESASTASASTLRRRWRVLTANSRDTTVPVRVALRSAARQPQDDHGTVGLRPERLENGTIRHPPSRNGTTASAIAHAPSG